MAFDKIMADALNQIIDIFLQLFQTNMKTGIWAQRGVTGKVFPKPKFPEMKKNHAHDNDFLIDTENFVRHGIKIKKGNLSGLVYVSQEGHPESAGVSYEDIARFHEWRTDFFGYNKKTLEQGKKAARNLIKKKFPEIVQEFKKGCKNIK